METIKEILKSICSQILTENKFFANGFYDTMLHDDKGLLLSNIDNQYLNITDVNGNYFYLGYKPKANVKLGPQLQEGSKTYQYCYDCFFVAITEGLDDLVLLNSIVNNIGSKFQTINTVSTNLPTIMAEELKPLNRKVIDSIISKMGNRQAVKITFTQCVQFQTQTCPIDPCNCCESDLNIVADYVTFNSDGFLVGMDPNDEYRYQCTYAEFNGIALPIGSRMDFRGDDIQIDWVPIQTPPFDTIPAHNVDNGLAYDKNWLTFLNSLPIAGFIQFDTSPFHDNGGTIGYPDLGFPNDEIGSVISLFGDDVSVYGEGFQIRRKQKDTFRFDIEYSYYDHSTQVVTVGHLISFTHEGMTIDGAFVPKANAKTYS